VQQHNEVLGSSDGIRLYTQVWLPDNPKAVVIISHGYAEHGGRYQHFATYLVENSFGVYALDHRGHGRSEGERANIKVFGEYVSDLGKYITTVREKHPNLKRFLLGHSMGGAIAAQFAIEQPNALNGLLLSSPYLINAVSVPAPLMAVSGFVSKVLPGLPTIKLDSKDISRDPAIVKAYDTDPLNYRGGTKARFGSELLSAGKYVLSRASAINLPVLIMIGTGDKIASPEGGKQLFNSVGSSDKTLKNYEGFYHEIINELGKEQVYKDIAEWLQKHV
jgi:alpha-beta hydrolase superfamily lysophospholipase